MPLPGLRIPVRPATAIGALALAFQLSACGGGDSPGPDTTPRVTGVAISPATATMVVGDQQALTITVNAVNGASTAYTVTSSNPGVATVSGTGAVQALTEGSTTITATSTFDATKSATASLTVNPRPAVTAVTIVQGNQAIVVGQSVPLTANVTVVGGASTAVTWTSSHPAIVSVSIGGTITGATVGTATVTATSVADATRSASVTVTVSPPPPSVTSVVVTPSAPTMVVDDVLQLNATVTTVSGASADVTWSSSNQAVATVSPNGQVTAVAAGTASITARSTFDNTKTGSAQVTVNPKPAVLSVTIPSSPPALIQGTTAQLAATVTAVGGAPTAVNWSTSAAGIATVSPSGLVTAVSPGNVTITATSVFDGTKQASAAIRVDANAIVLSVSVGPATLSIARGDNGQLTATVTVGNNASQQVVWSSSNETVATVNQAGRVTGVAAGNATIRATAQADATKFAEAQVTVTAPAFPLVASVTATTESQFTPGSVDIAATGTVTWTFQSIAHNVTFGGAAGAPSSVPTSANTNVSRTFNQAGSFSYTCTLHPGMDGTVVVH